MGLNERNGGSRASGPAFRGGIQPLAREGALRIGNPGDLAALFARRPPAAVTHYRDLGVTPHAVSVNGGNTVFTPAIETSTAREPQRNFQTEHREREKIRFTLTTNPTLDALCLAITQMPQPNWFDLMRKLAHLPVDKNPESLHGKLAEVYAASLFATLSQTDQFRGKLKIQALNGLAVNGYRLARDHEGRTNAFADNGLAHAEYDNFIIVNGLPTVVEVKAKSDPRTGKKSFNQCLTNEHIGRVIKPLKQRYGKRFGYLVLTVAECIDTGSPEQRQFIDRGGKIIVMKPSLQEFKQYAGSVLSGSSLQIDLPPVNSHRR